MARCTHLDQIRAVRPLSEACAECVALGDPWVHLRLCRTCGHVGCCDESKNRHAARHFHTTRHPIIQSLEPGEAWSWCYLDETLLDPDPEQPLPVESQAQAQSVIRHYLLIAGLYTLSTSLIWGVNTLFLLDAGLDLMAVFTANALFTGSMALFEIPTGGLGTGGGLGSQGALVISGNGQWLLAVNAGSDSVSAFAVRPNGLQLTDTEPSGGERPISVTVHDGLVYVLNGGGASNLAGFRLGADGQLTALAGSVRPLSNGGAGAAPGPAQVAFSPDGRTLVVTEKASDLILMYAVGPGGQAGVPTALPSASTTPFGFAFGLQGTLVISEAFGGAPDASAASSYHLSGAALQLVSASAPTHQTAACWVAVTGNGKFATPPTPAADRFRVTR